MPAGLVSDEPVPRTLSRNVGFFSISATGSMQDQYCVQTIVTKYLDIEHKFINKNLTYQFHLRRG